MHCETFFLAIGRYWWVNLQNQWISSLIPTFLYVQAVITCTLGLFCMILWWFPGLLLSPMINTLLRLEKLDHSSASPLSIHAEVVFECERTVKVTCFKHLIKYPSVARCCARCFPCNYIPWSVITLCILSALCACTLQVHMRAECTGASSS